MNKMKSDNAHIKHLYNTIHIFYFFLWLYKLKDLICKINTSCDGYIDLKFSHYAKKKRLRELWGMWSI